MKEIEEIEARREAIVQQMQSMRSMQRGSINEQFFEAQIKDGKQSVKRGPYYVLSRHESGKTVSRRLRTQRELEQARLDVAAYKRFATLCREFEQLTQRLGELERQLAEESQEKKLSRSRWRGPQR